MVLRSIGLLLVLLVAAIPSARADETEATNVERTKSFYETVINAGNIEAVDAFLAPDYVEHETVPGFEPTREGVKAFFSAWRAGFPDLKLTVDFCLADGDKVAAYLTATGTHEGEFMGIAPTGKTIDIHIVDIVRIEDGVAVEHWGVTDVMRMMAQLGVAESPEMGEMKMSSHE